MLRSLLIINNGGLVIFYKSWVALGLPDEEKELIRMGSVFRTIQEQALQSTRCTPVYIQFASVASSIVTNHPSKLLCILLHDIEDGSDLGGLLADSILRTFIVEFNGQDFTRAIQMDPFLSYHQKLPDAISAVYLRILDDLKETRGIKGAMFKPGEDSDTLCNIDNIDEIGIAANLTGVLEAASDLIATKGETIDWVSLSMSTYIVYIHRFGESSLVSLCRNNVSKQKYINSIENAVVLLSKVSELMWKLQGA